MARLLYRTLTRSSSARSCHHRASLYRHLASLALRRGIFSCSLSAAHIHLYRHRIFAYQRHNRAHLPGALIIAYRGSISIKTRLAVTQTPHASRSPAAAITTSHNRSLIFTASRSYRCARRLSSAYVSAAAAARRGVISAASCQRALQRYRARSSRRPTRSGIISAASLCLAGGITLIDSSAARSASSSPHRASSRNITLHQPPAHLVAASASIKASLNIAASASRRIGISSLAQRRSAAASAAHLALSARQRNGII